jgi:hypothetical protein
MNPSGSMELQTHFEGKKTFLLKNKSTLTSRYVLSDEAGQELLIVQPSFSWSKTNYDYTISSTPIFEQLTMQPLLLAAVVHGTNHYLTTMSAILGSMAATT